MFEFVEATKEKSKARIALVGPSGAGKTYTALSLATAFGGPVVVVDTEHGSASKYSSGEGFSRFLTLKGLDRYDPRQFPKMLAAAAKHCAGGTLIIDSFTSWWSGVGGMQELVDNIAAQSKSKNSFKAWGMARPFEKAMFEAILTFPAHVIVTMRAKTEYVMEADRNGNVQPRKVGLAPEQRQGVEYEFDIVGDMTIENELVVSKSRCRAVRERGRFPHPGDELAKLILSWLDDGAEPAAQTSVETSEGSAVGSEETPEGTSQDLVTPLRVSELMARMGKVRSMGELQEVWAEVNAHKAEFSDEHMALLRSRKDDVKRALAKRAAEESAA